MRMPLMIGLLLMHWGQAPSPVAIMAAPVGVLAPDTVDGQPGNPFATAFIEVLGDEAAPLPETIQRLKSRTQAISKGALLPEVSPIAGDPATRLGARSGSERRVALVLVHSTYTRGWPRLKGAAVDAERVAAALRRAGFDTRMIVDPDRGDRAAALRWLAEESKAADVALLYSTGHGIMHEEDGYLLDSDFAQGWREDQLSSHAIKISELGVALKAKQANLLLFGGCRSYEWWA